jgi:hypothetical protein
MKTIKFISVQLIIPLALIFLTYATFDKDKFMHGIHTINWSLLTTITLCLVVFNFLCWQFSLIKKRVMEKDIRKAFNNKIDKLTAQLKESYELQEKWKNEEDARFNANKQPYIDQVEEYKKRHGDSLTLIEDIKRNNYQINQSIQIKIEEIVNKINTPLN